MRVYKSAITAPHGQAPGTHKFFGRHASAPAAPSRLMYFAGVGRAKRCGSSDSEDKRLERNKTAKNKNKKERKVQGKEEVQLERRKRKANAKPTVDKMPTLHVRLGDGHKRRKINGMKKSRKWVATVSKPRWHSPRLPHQRESLRTLDRRKHRPAEGATAVVGMARKGR